MPAGVDRSWQRVGCAYMRCEVVRRTCFDDDLDAVAERLDVIARTAGVAYPLPAGRVVDLESARK